MPIPHEKTCTCYRCVTYRYDRSVAVAAAVLSSLFIAAVTAVAALAVVL